jgi:hypothetical protein
MLNANATQGVCSVCKFGSACNFESGAVRVILQCEQFEPAFPAQKSRPMRTQSRAMPANGEHADDCAGICTNCGNRETCTYPKPEGGIWRCEDYV